MKKLLVLIVTLAALWAGYWFVGAAGVKAGFAVWFDARQSEGWQAEYSDLSVKGFPNRFDTTLTDPALADPATGLAWSAPFVQLFALHHALEDHSYDTICLLVVAVKAPFVLHKQQDKQTGSNTNRQTGNIDKRHHFVALQVAQGYCQVAFYHLLLLLSVC